MRFGCIYKDKSGDIWFGGGGGASRYDGKSFRNYVIDGMAMNEDITGKSFSERQPSAVNSILQDRKGMFWFGTTVNTFIYDGKTFSLFTDNGKPFKISLTLSKTEKALYGSAVLVMTAIHLLIFPTVQFFVSTKIEMAIFGQIRQVALQKRIGYYRVTRRIKLFSSLNYIVIHL